MGAAEIVVTVVTAVACLGMGVDTAVVKTIKGLVLLGAVAVDILSKRKKS